MAASAHATVASLFSTENYVECTGWLESHNEGQNYALSKFKAQGIFPNWPNLSPPATDLENNCTFFWLWQLSCQWLLLPVTRE